MDTIELVEESFAKLPDGKKFAELFYQRISEHSPHLMPLFANTSMTKMADKLLAALTAMVAALHDPEKLQNMLGPLGQRHLSYGVLESHYSIVGQTLLQTFEEELGEEWTDDYAAAWSEVYSNAAQIMQEGAAKAKAQNQSTTETAKKPVKTGALAWLYSLPVPKLLILWLALSVVVLEIAAIYGVPNWTRLLSACSLVLLIMTMLRGNNDAEKAGILECWKTIDSSHGVKTSRARQIAMERLNEKKCAMNRLDLAEVCLIKISLDGADLSDSNLSEADLTESSLAGANFTKARLDKALLVSVYAPQVDMSFVTLAKANLSSSNLEKGSFLFCNMKGANLSGANLKGANLTGVLMDKDTYLSGADLRGAIIDDSMLDQAYTIGMIRPDGSVVTEV
ncbi:pentapeptide repeat-containing protein [Enterovibrio makurazakiensis]|uniref:pentapeptide repeat-containing protein n=1 Tax=Enterovibrio makurazakiensis TaxID=2910232 RepID=UPI003D22808E